ncbi:origin recognition complex subunit 3 [Galendromus occidentalis]|uniref:Origin recognition complex subunit 3 n=1 Tax=Galendromus occidentalis TaxID=34638 RepID=A0AAJ6QT13_9ACAR|nr:origin recognition complex subunit 3 [Galendromus occidentalis]
MDTPLISRSCHVRKPPKPKKGPLSRYISKWEDLESKICAFHVRKHERLIEDVCTYFKNFPISQDICTATLRFGSSVSDQSGIFEELASQLTGTTELVCRLTPIDCHSLSSIVQKLFHEFVDAACPNDAPRLKKSLVTFENLVQIFKLITKNAAERQRSPKKRRDAKPSVTGTKVIIIIEDVTSVAPTILEDFCLILKNHLDTMETCLVFGMSSTSQSVHKLLTFKCSSCLSIQTFTSPPVPETLAEIFELLVLNRDFPLKLSPEVYNWLNDFVLFHDFSLTTLLHILRVALTLHLQTVDENVIEALFQPGLDVEVDEAHLAHHDTDLHLEELSKLFIALGESKSVNFKECYLALQKDNFLESVIFKKVEQTIKFLSTDELKSRLMSYIEKTKESDQILREDLLESIVDLIRRLFEEDLQENLAENEDTNFSDVKSRFELKSKLLMAAQKKRTTRLDVVKEDLIGLLKSDVKSLKTPSSLKMYNEVYIRNAKELENFFNPSQRSRVHQALATPSVYLNCKCCQVKSTELKAELPPISLAYKLHLECGKMINIYDWLQSYQTVREDSSKLSIAQFLRAVRELTLVGFVKPTTRKTDHCQRLTWGSC